MKNFIVALLALIPSVAAQAVPASYFTQLLATEQVQKLEETYKQKNMELVNVKEDTKALYLCLCWDFVVTYKNLQTGETAEHKFEGEDVNFNGKLTFTAQDVR